MQQGKITRVTDRGFGFIAQDGQEKDLFFHSNELQNVQFDELQEGDIVTFEVAEGPKGQNAVNINRVDADAAPAAEEAPATEETA